MSCPTGRHVRLLGTLFLAGNGWCWASGPRCDAGASRASSRRSRCQDVLVDKLPQGWSRPLKPSEVPRVFPMAGSIAWNGRAQGWQKATALPVVWLAWSPDSAQAQPVLTVWAVPSSSRSTIRRHIHDVVSAQAIRWFESVVNDGETARATPHTTGWYWTGAEFIMSDLRFKRPRRRS